jgi:putative mRNA 3-end processing factor
MGSCAQYSMAGSHNATMQSGEARDTTPAAAAGAELIVLRPQGLYCPAGDFYIDPWRPVGRAVITHAHADHARPGHRHYLCSTEGAGLLRARLGDVSLQTLAWGEALHWQGVRISLHPAGHVLGSAQVRVECRGQVWVASGDYFSTGSGERNPSCTAFEALRCHCFITESTFGLPIYKWRPQAEVLADINTWWQHNADAHRPSLLMAYSLGKAQRLLAGVDASIGPVLVHGAVEPLNQAYRAAGVALAPCRPAAQATTREAWSRALIIAPPAVHGSAWARRFGDFSDAFASGWMQLRGARRRQGVDRGFVLSDHADWPGLHAAIRATGAERVIVTHGYEAMMVRWLQEQGLEAGAFRTEYGDHVLDGV